MVSYTPPNVPGRCRILYLGCGSVRWWRGSFPISVLADPVSGKIVNASNGDTVYVLDANYEQHKIRLAGIDAPERKRAYGLASRKHLASIVASKEVTVEYQKRDRYGRIVGKVLLDGIDACQEQVKAGFAWHYKKY